MTLKVLFKLSFKIVVIVTVSFLNLFLPFYVVSHWYPDSLYACLGVHTLRTHCVMVIITTKNGVIVVGTPNLPGTLANSASMLYSNNLTNFITSIFREGELVISEEDDILVGAPEGSDFYISGMGGVLICQDGQIHTKQSKLGGII